MVEISALIYEKINKFLSELERNQIHIQKAILFDSYVKGTNDEWSDIDLAIVSDDFTGDRFEDKSRLRKFKAVAEWDVSPLPFRREDFENSFFVRDEILKNGIVII
ncbi:MAG: nucleotidyltransferase [Ignavibacteria bacterium]|nr:nucleotidyltransferase [Ignavibacteria bacterium]